MTKKYIDAEELNKLLCEAKSSIPVFNGGICKAKMIVREMPAADVEEVKHGKWIKVPSATHKDIYFYDCSICKASIHSKTDSGLYSAIEWNGGINLRCPYCGAKMDEKAEMDGKESKE